MTTLICDEGKCVESASYRCDCCYGHFCGEHVKAGKYYRKDADDYGFKVDENGDEHYCLGCLE